mmetsp:Transcript_21220/g.41502  ORF Transcript_21220/g.41502 Transcript_21220/m.41502 type:complete len:473 (+) Transcript_21220:198-1616(+)|eukprot:CAMPEP_0172675044 /NCGR_PEP_ID=MMETSP1074-20121228/13059_1 /TAXON_ID=2916 /ORGANISM="Ceratium fusus, Strain PA161109" /LENGTH=472 /DNA_ID=CAMNT_0013492491 /DNA_START=161 /DNA_END=1579 /DNA_ORIENTATION=+
MVSTIEMKEAAYVGPPGVPTAEKMLGPSLQINSVYVRFQGLKRISPHSLVGECSALAGVRTLGGVEHALNDALVRLHELELLKSVQTELSLDQNGTVTVDFVVEEKKRECTVSGNVDKKGQMTCDLRVVQPAALGGTLSAMASVGSTASGAQDFLLRLSTPRFLAQRCSWSLDLARSATDEREASSYSERVTHAVMKLTNPTGKHSIFVEAALRSLFPADRGLRVPSAEVLQARLDSVKTSLSYTYAWVGAAPSVLRLYGGPACMRGNIEAAGLLGDVNFLRGETYAGATWCLPWRLRWQVASWCGLLWPFRQKQNCLQDRFFLGGSTGSSSVFKGFAHRGLGPMGFCETRDPANPPNQLTDALGGDAVASAYSAISIPCPIPLSLGGVSIDSSLFAFVGVGGLAQHQLGLKSGTRILQDLRTSVRASAGAGLALPMAGLGSLELTFAQPFQAHHHDIQQRWQIGLRFDVKG